jgi:hypothetical protein
MAEVLRFETNVPVEIALAYPCGKLVEGRYGDQYYYSLADGRSAYVEPVVERKRQELGIGKGEPFTVCKKETRNGNRRSIEWQVARVDPAPETPLARQLEQSIRKVEEAKKPAIAAPAPVASGAPENTGNNQQTDGSAPAPTLLAMSLRAAIDAARDAEQYAARQNYSLRFTSEDLRAMALSLYIQGAREGGAAWRH